MSLPSQEPVSDPSSSTPFGQYQLEEKIAQGGMAEIFKGKALDDHGTERPIVIKRILPHIAASPEFVEMLIDEAKIAVMLSHGNIAQVYDLGKVADDYFIVMEYVDGKTLSQIMKRLRTQGKLMPVPYAVYLIREIAEALDYMHRRTDEEGRPLNIIHRDISPQNAILSTSGTVKIIDFGIAKAKNKISTTDSGVLKGKFAYMSPEHAEGLKLDHRTDIFSLGVIFWELLTNQRLFKCKTNLETVRKVKKAKVPKPSEDRQVVPKDLDRIVLQALARDREKRYASAHDLVLDLTKFLVRHYPNFSPRELVEYLPSLFPEISLSSDNQKQESTEIKPYQPQNGVEGEALPIEGPAQAEARAPEEDTIAANSELLKLKHRESEVFAVEGSEKTDSSVSRLALDEEMHSVPVETEEALPVVEEKTSRMKTDDRRWIRPVAMGLALLMGAAGLGWAGYHLAPRIKKRLHFVKRNNLSESLGQPVQKISVPPAASEPVPAPVKTNPFGTLLVESTPSGADIFLNDGQTRFKTPHTFEELKPGPVTVGLHLERYQFWQKKTSLEAGEVGKISGALSLNLGLLEIVSVPSGADVFVNENFSGKTPLTLKDLQPDTLYRVVLKLNGYEDWIGRSKVFGGSGEMIQAVLQQKKKTEKTLPE